MENQPTNNTEYEAVEPGFLELAVQHHDQVAETIATELGVDSVAAEKATGEYFVDKVNADIRQGVSHYEVIIDVDAALVSGIRQRKIDTNGLIEPFDSGDPYGYLESDESLENPGPEWEENPIAQLEATYPEIVTEAITELASEAQGAKIAQMIAKTVDWFKELPSKVTPVINMATGTVMSLHSANKYNEFKETVEQARVDITGNLYENWQHRIPTLEEFKEWKKTGVVEPGVEPPESSLWQFGPPLSGGNLSQQDVKPTPPSPWSPEAKSSESGQGGLSASGEYASPWEDKAAPIEESEPFILPLEGYLTIEGTYAENIQIAPAEAGADMAPEDIARRLEIDRTAKHAPRLSEQLKEGDRTNEIVFIAGKQQALHTVTSNEEYRADRQSITEQESLRSLDDFLEKASKGGTWTAERAAAMRETLTFIGEKEYREATEGIATYWKAALDNNESLQILAVAGEIAKSGGYSDGKGGDQIKSDDFLLENILSHFSAEDLSKYGDRLIVDADSIVATDPENLKVVLLDDWTISGSQLTNARAAFIRQHPRLASSVEIQLIAANEDRIKHGLRGYDDAGKEISTPLRAYYMAHHSDHASRSNAHITGFHSSVDFDFEDEIDVIVRDMRSRGEEVTMVAPTNIVRPYRYDGVSRSSFVHRERVRANAKQRRKERILT